MMNKCFDEDGNITCPCFQGEVTNRFECAKRNDCHLAPLKQALIRNLLEREHSEDTVRIMEAASRGVWRCETCASEGKGLDDGLCYTTGYLTGAPCAKWQERKEDGNEC